MNGPQRASKKPRSGPELRLTFFLPNGIALSWLLDISCGDHIAQGHTSTGRLTRRTCRHILPKEPEISAESQRCEKKSEAQFWTLRGFFDAVWAVHRFLSCARLARICDAKRPLVLPDTGLHDGSDGESLLP